MQHLIGPVLFPVYWYAVQLVIGIVAAFHLMVVVVSVVAGRSPKHVLVGTWASFWVWSMAGLGALTFCFGLVEFFGKGRIPFADAFDPKELPEVKRGPHSTLANSVVELVMGGLFMVGWMIFLHAPTPVFAAPIPIHLAPVWYRFEIPMLLTVALGMVAAYVHIFRPQSPRLRTILRLTGDVTGVITFYFFLGASRFIVYQSSTAMNEPVHFGKLVMSTGELINYAAALPVAITMFTMFISGLVQVTRLAGRRQTKVWPHLSGGIF
jgi:TRAP-type mannitol/chloroaromatic compound transport system permease small subunit